MTKGTTANGQRASVKTHGLCKRCNRRSFKYQTRKCASCGYPSAKTRDFPGVHMKAHRRKTTGTGRMRYLRHVPRRFKNGFREGTVATKKTKATA